MPPLYIEFLGPHHCFGVPDLRICYLRMNSLRYTRMSFEPISFHGRGVVCRHIMQSYGIWTFTSQRATYWYCSSFFVRYLLGNVIALCRREQGFYGADSPHIINGFGGCSSLANNSFYFPSFTPQFYSTVIFCIAVILEVHSFLFQRDQRCNSF